MTSRHDADGAHRATVPTGAYSAELPGRYGEVRVTSLGSMARCRWALVILAALGVVVSHAAAYLVAPPHHSHGAVDMHGYLQLAAPVVVLAAVAGMGWLVAARSGIRRRLPTTAAVASAQAVAFVAQEVVEHALGPGIHAALTSPAVWLGLALQAVVAGVLLWLTRAGRRVVERLRNSPPGLRAAAPGCAHAAPVGWPARWERAPRRRRGPPPLRVVNLT